MINRTPNYYSYTSLDLVWVPRADGEFLADDPQRLVQRGTVANIPIVTGKYFPLKLKNNSPLL